MACNYSIQIGDKSYDILQGVENGKIQDIDDLKQYLRTVDINKLKEIKTALEKNNAIGDLDLKDMNENAVGLFSPAALLKSVSTNSEDAYLWNQLNVGNRNKKNIIPGFGDESMKTGFINGHIFLNLNYLSDKDNNIIALTELALHQKYANDAKVYSDKISSNPTSEAAQQTLQTLFIPGTNISDVQKIIGAITLAYQRVNLKLTHDIGESNLTTSRNNLEVTWNKYNNLRNPENLNSNYLPKSDILTQDLKPGDLVWIPIESTEKTLKAGVFELFYDSYVNTQGKTVLRTLIKNSATGNIETRKRIARRFDSKNHIIESNTVQGRIQDSAPYTLYDYQNDTQYNKINTKFTDGYVTYESILNLLHNPQSQVILLSHTDGKVIEKVHNIKQVQGSVVTLDNDQIIPIEDIQRINYPKDNNEAFGNLEGDLLNNKGWSKSNHITVGEHIAFKKNPKDTILTEGIVLARGKRGDENILVYRDAKNTENKRQSILHYISEKNVKYVSSPPVEFHVSTEEESLINNFIQTNFINNNQYIKPIDVFIKPKHGALKDLGYSIHQLNKFSKISPKDLLYDMSSNKVFKVVHSGIDTIKATLLINGQVKYFDLPKDIIDKYLLFTKNPINESFAQSFLRKNRANLYKNNQEGAIEVKVWQNPNGFIYPLAAHLTNEQRTEHILYGDFKNENGKVITVPIDITNKIAQELADRYKWNEIPSKLYTKEYYNIETKKNNIVKDTENTLRIPIDNENFKALLANTDQLQSYLVPGSFIQFKGNATSFLVEKVYNDRIQLAAYHHTQIKNEAIRNLDLQYVTAEKFFLDRNLLENSTTTDPQTKKIIETPSKAQIVNLYLPKWATTAYDNLSMYRKQIAQKDSRLITYPDSDSPEIVAMLADVLQNKYNTPIKIIHNYNLAEFNNPNVYKSSAFATPDSIYINIDKASIAEPLHEVLHLVLATMKATDPDTYYKLVNSVQYHPLFDEVTKAYDEINTERLEETFITLLSQTFRRNILKEGVYNESSFNRAMKQSISDLMDLSKSLDWEDSFDLLGKPINDILFDFGSRLVANDDSLIKNDSVSYMFDIADKIQKLLDNGNLKQQCNY